MTVKQLIVRLAEMPPGAEVWWQFGSPHCSGKVERVSLGMPGDTGESDVTLESED